MDDDKLCQKYCQHCHALHTGSTYPDLELLQFTVDVDVEVMIHRQEMFCQHTKPAWSTESVH